MIIHKKCITSNFINELNHYFYIENKISCIEIGSKSYIKGSTDRICYDDEYYYYGFIFVLPFMAIWVIILPGILFFKMYLLRTKLHYIRSKIILGFIYSDYRRKFFYWEAVKMVYRILIIITENVLYERIHGKALIMILIVYFY